MTMRAARKMKPCKAIATVRAAMFRGLEGGCGQDFAQSGLLNLRWYVTVQQPLFLCKLAAFKEAAFSLC